MRTWKNDIARDNIPTGVWSDEPDKAHWIDEATDLDCLIHRNDLGTLCGYVGVTEGHPFFEKDYDNLYDDITVHGGLTYSDKCQETGDEAIGICHVPLPGRAEDVWWLGFDCGHAYDLTPSWSMPGTTYRDFQYVKTEVESLAAQLKEVMPA